MPNSAESRQWIWEIRLCSLVFVTAISVKSPLEKSRLPNNSDGLTLASVRTSTGGARRDAEEPFASTAAPRTAVTKGPKTAEKITIFW